jgi:hypothetical protein
VEFRDLRPLALVLGRRAAFRDCGCRLSSTDVDR